MIVGKQMPQFFGARANFGENHALYAINGGVDEKLKIRVGRNPNRSKGDVLNFDSDGPHGSLHGLAG